MTLHDKLKDWLELKNMIETITTIKNSHSQRKAIELYVSKGMKYHEKYGERFNTEKKPEINFDLYK